MTQPFTSRIVCYHTVSRLAKVEALSRIYKRRAAKSKYTPQSPNEWYPTIIDVMNYTTRHNHTRN